MKIKGYTVHYEAVNGKAACGVTPRFFRGYTALSREIARVTCPKCEVFARTQQYGDTPADDGIRAAREDARAMNRNAVIRHDVTYTTPMLDGTRPERRAVIRRSRALTYRGAERILRNERADKGIIVTRLDYCAER